MTIDGLSVADVVRRIKLAIRQANIGGDGEDLAIAGVELTLKVLATDAGGAGFEWKVPVLGLTLKGGAKATHSNTSTVHVALVPPDHEGGGGALKVDADLEDELVNGVHLIREAVNQSAVSEPQFKLKEGSVELEFVVTKEGNLSLLLTAEAKDEVTHTMKLLLATKNAAKQIRDKTADMPERLAERWDALG
jgi:hypothetical protein